MRELLEREEGKMAIITFVIFVRFYEPPTLLADLIGANPSCACLFLPALRAY